MVMRQRQLFRQKRFQNDSDGRIQQLHGHLCRAARGHHQAGAERRIRVGKKTLAGAPQTRVCRLTDDCDMLEVLFHQVIGKQKKEVQHEGGVEDAEPDHMAAFQGGFGRQQGHGVKQRFPYEGWADGYL